jgi:prophage maintenance system killer protein
VTLRLTEEEIALLRQQAEREGRSMHEVVRLAIQGADRPPGPQRAGPDRRLPTLHEKAAALLDAVVRNHALVDGNMRLGWASRSSW